MARISLQEQYENKDVIQQIYSLKDDVNRVSETTENVNKDVIQQINNVKDNVNAVSGTAEEAKTLAQQASDKAEEVGISNQSTVTSGSIIADTVSAKLKLNKVSGASEDSVIPIASASQTGMMNAQTYAGITNIEARLSVLEGKSTTVYVTFPNNDPEQSIITSTFNTKAGRPPVAGDYVVDITLNLTYGYDGSVWVKVDTDVPIPQFSIDTPGLIKGNDEDGTVFAEADGTGSVKGWDALKQSVQNNTTAIEQNSTAIEQNSTAIGQNVTNVNALDARVTTLESVPESAQWEELDVSNLPTDFQAGDILMCFLKTIVSDPSFPDSWKTVPNSPVTRITDDRASPAVFTIGTTDLFCDTTYSMMIYKGGIMLNSIRYVYGANYWNSGNSEATLFRLTLHMFNGAGATFNNVFIKRSDISKNVARILRLRPN